MLKIWNKKLFFLFSEIKFQEDEEDMYEIPESQEDVSLDKPSESKPIVRKIGEFKLWKRLFLFSFLALFCSFFECFDLPVFWPILLFYFLLVVITIAYKQYKHMQKYDYSFADFFKKKDEGVKFSK